jgi:hypothetical protein
VRRDYSEVFTLARDENDRDTWILVDKLHVRDGWVGSAPRVLSVWLDQDDRDPGTYKCVGPIGDSITVSWPQVRA